MKKFLFVILAFITNIAFAQKGIDEMIAAEKAFASYSVANNTIDAFLKFMDTSAVMFKNGEPYKSYNEWLKKEKRPGVLNWRPRYAEMAASGDFGWTAGPWTFQPQTVSDSVVANGYFFTIWKKNSTGEWKFILDVGTDTGPMMNETGVTKISIEKGRGTAATLLDAEKKFSKLYQTDTAKAYNDFLSDKTIVVKQKTGLIVNKSTWRPTPAAVPGTWQFTVLGSGIAPSGDIGFTYGSVLLNDKKETYLRIWRHELRGWKIALELIRL